MYGCYGGIMGSFPSFTSSLFGIEHTGENYGFVMPGSYTHLGSDDYVDEGNDSDSYDSGSDDWNY